MGPRLLLSLLLVVVSLRAAAVPLVRNARVIPTQNVPHAVLKGNFGGDASPDVLLIDSTAKTLQVLVNQPAVLFAAPVVTSLVVSVHDAAVGDTDGDGYLDLLTSSHAVGTGQAKLRVYRGAGNGSFTVGAELDALLLPGTVAIADFTGDGHADLICACAPERNDLALVVYPGNGAGAFGPAITSAVDADSPRTMAVMDANADGRKDVVLSTFGGTQVLLGGGAGTFSVSFSRSVYGGLATGDFNGDGKADFAIASDSNQSYVVEVNLGNGNGTFQTAGQYPVPYRSSAVRAADVDADGDVDLLTAGYGGSVGVLRNNGTGSFANPVLWLGAYFDLVADDFDRNGSVDVVGLESNSRVLSILRGVAGGGLDGERSYMPLKTVPVSYPGSSPTNARAADMDGDGDIDVVVRVRRLSQYDYQLAVLLNDGTGVLGESILTDLADPSYYGQAFVTGDVNGDGYGDVVFMSATARTYLGKGDGTFHAPVQFTMQHTGEGELQDVNGDGKLDLLTDGLEQLGVQLGDGAGSFGTQVMHNGLGADAVGDVNGDGRVDVIAKMSGLIRVGINDGSGGFPWANVDTGDYPLVGGLRDFNNDGKLDLLILLYSGIRVRFGAGDGTFPTYVDMVTPRIASSSSTVHIADFDQDGLLDFAVDSWIFRGNGDGGFRSLARFRSISAQSDVAAFDGNASPDLLMTDWSSGTISIVRTMVGPAPELQPALSLTSDKAAAAYAETVTFTATLSGDAATPPTGSVSFARDGRPFALALVTGAPIVQTRAFGLGTGDVTATYSGDEIYQTASDSVALTVTQAATGIHGGAPSVITCGNTLVVNVGFTATVASGVLPGPTGSIVLRKGSQVLHARSAVPGLLIFSYSGLAVGHHDLTIEYTGDPNYASSQHTFPVTVNPWIFSLSAGTAVYAGASGNFASISGTTPASATFNWTIENGTIESGQGTKAIRYTAGATGEVQLRVTMTHSTACNSPASLVVPIIVRQQNATMLYVVTPCRVLDTRDSTAMPASGPRDATIGGSCGIPVDAKSVVGNVTVVAPPGSGWLSLFARGTSWPGTSTVNYRTGRSRANQVIVPLSSDGRLTILNEGAQVHIVFDVSGYFR